MTPTHATCTDTPAFHARAGLGFLDHVVVHNATSAVVYVSIADTSVDGSSGVGTFSDPVPVAVGVDKIIVERVYSAGAVVRATTSADGTGTPSPAVDVTLQWD